MSEKIDIKHLAHLARIQLDETKNEQLEKQLGGVFEFIDQLQSAEVKAVEPLSHPLEAEQPLRADAVTEPDMREKLMQQAPEKHSGLLLVPPVIE